ncbi:MAG: type II toxin-antitoxin system VapC family toxin [Pseudonocardiaceae bacterium]
MIYLDSSAILKLVVPELESAALFEYLDAAEGPLASSELASVEVHRALRRMGTDPDDEHHALADAVLTELDQLPLAPVLRAAALLPGRWLRSLDALHLATAQQLPSLRTLITYDHRLAQHATAAGLRAEAPASPEDEPAVRQARDARDAGHPAPDEDN